MDVLECPRSSGDVGQRPRQKGSKPPGMVVCWCLGSGSKSAAWVSEAAEITQYRFQHFNLNTRGLKE